MQLFDHRLIVVSGKGGVGKTTVSLLLALLAKQKKKVLLVEMNSSEQIAPFFGLQRVGHQEVLLDTNLHAINLNPNQCFEEYVLKQIFFKKIFDLFINNRFVRSFLDAVPGLFELLMVGKIYDLVKQNRYDLVIVDAPATGHGISSFEVPQIVLQAVRSGPLNDQAKKVFDLLTNSQKTTFSIVSLAEEMPMNETCELYHQVKTKLKMKPGPVFINKLKSSFLSSSENKKLQSLNKNSKGSLDTALSFVDFHHQRSLLNGHYQKKIKERLLQASFYDLPYIYGGIEQIADFSSLEKVLKFDSIQTNQLIHHCPEAVSP